MRQLRSLATAAGVLAALSAYAIEVTAKSAIILDAKTGKVLWEKDADTKRFPASTTKIMTTLLLLERTRPEEIITAPLDIEKVRESSMHLKPLEQITAQDLAYALMLRSANDGSHAAAIHLAGSVSEFAKMMNERARQAGATNTQFNNPHGLNDEKHLTTARDLALIAREAMKNPEFEEIARTKRRAIVRSVNVKDVNMVSRNKWLFRDETADGIKTGYTRPAGHCYVGSATRDGYRIITVVLKSENWKKDHEEMLDWAFKYHTRLPLTEKGQVVGRAPVVGGTVDTVPIAPKEDLDTILRRSDSGETPRVETELKQDIEAPVLPGQEVGTMTITDRDGFEQKVTLVAAGQVAPSIVAQVAGVGSNGSNWIYGAGLATVGYAVIVGRRRKRRSKYGQTASRQA